MTHAEATAHVFLRPAIESLVESVRAASLRVTSGHDDEEAVHDFRVGIRRLRSTLRAGRRMYGKKRVRGLEAELKRFGSATGALRDAEVLEETLRAALPAESAHAWQAVEAWLEARRAHERELRERAVSLLRQGELDACLEAIDALVAEGARRDRPIFEFARRCFAAFRGDAQRAVPSQALVAHDGDELFDAMHKLRIRFKRLRYTCEMLVGFMDVIAGSAAPRDERDKAGARSIRYATAAEDATSMQRELGHLQDAHATGTVIFGEESFDSDARATALEALTNLRARLLGSALAALRRLDYLPG